MVSVRYHGVEDNTTGRQGDRRGPCPKAGQAHQRTATRTLAGTQVLPLLPPLPHGELALSVRRQRRSPRLTGAWRSKLAWVLVAGNTLGSMSKVSKREQRQYALMRRRVDDLRRRRGGIGPVIGDLEALLWQLQETPEDWRDRFIEAWSVLEISYAVAVAPSTGAPLSRPRRTAT